MNAADDRRAPNITAANALADVGPTRPATRDDIDHIRDLVRAGVVGPWHYRWPEMQATAARLGITPQDAVYRAHDGNWSPNRKPAATAADFIREANAR